MTNTERLIELIGYLTEEQASTLHDLITRFSSGYMTKGDLLKLCTNQKERNNIDTAIPLGRVRQIEEVYPGFKIMFHVYNYNDESKDRMTNVCEMLVLHLINIFQ
jgi:CRISPR/Cas system CSM-associated protein Csm3 (group 7 of RAMP superfamily)